MQMQMEKVGNHKIDYKNPNSLNFSDLSEYILLAKKSISKFANRFYHGLSTQMLKNEDAISSIAYAIMMADWRYDENYGDNEDQRKTKYSYRNQCALWAIKTYLTKSNKKTKKNKNSVYSLNYTKEDSIDTYNYIADEKTKTPYEDMVANEDYEIINDTINDLLNTDGVSKKQNEYIRLYYLDGYTYQQIGDMYGLTKEAIRQSIIRAINTIKEKNS